MIELRLELQPYSPRSERVRSRTNRVERSTPARRVEWDSSTTDGDQWDVSLRRPRLPRRDTALAEDTYEFGVVRVPEFEL